jgi:hypothetical protein
MVASISLIQSLLYFLMNHVLICYCRSQISEPCYNVKGSVTCVPYRHDMARPQVADGGDGLQIWRVATNILNKQSWTADMGWSSSLGAGLWG